MPHVGVERLGTGDGEHHIAHRHQRHRLVGVEEGNAVQRIERQQHMRIGDEVVDAQRSERAEPEQHDRAKEGADRRRAAFLHEEQAEEDQQRDRNDIAVQLRRDDFQALHGG